MSWTESKLRQEEFSSEISDHKNLERETPALVLPELFHLTPESRRHQRKQLKIPVRLSVGANEISGHTQNISLGGLQVVAGTTLKVGEPLTLQCSFGGICYLNISGQVVFCFPATDEAGNAFSIGIKFCAMRRWEQTILASAVEELCQNTATQEQSLLTITVSNDTVALEAANFFIRTAPTKPKCLTRRVVITGIGPVAPNGIGRDAFWKGLAEGKNCVDRISSFDPSGHPSQVAAEIRDFDPSAIIPAKEVKRMGRSAHLGVAAAQLAVQDTSLQLCQELKSKIGVIVGTGTSGLEYAEHDFYAIRTGGVRQMRPYAAIAGFGGALSSEISRALGLTGPSITISTGCTGATDAMGLAFNTIRHGMADILITGGSDACVTPGILGAFCQIGATCTSYNHSPSKASRPFNKDRDGFVIGEGAWIFIFEELGCALRRGARIYGEIAGYAATCDAYHMSRPLPSGQYSAQAMRLALLDASVRPEEVDYINAYGNATKINDSYETLVIKQVFGSHAQKLMVSSIKSMIGHSIGSCGAGGLAATLMAISEGIVPPTINYETPDPECDLDYVPNVARRAAVNVALCNTLAFGSKNSVLLLTHFNQDD